MDHARTSPRSVLRKRTSVSDLIKSTRNTSSMNKGKTKQESEALTFPTTADKID